jgi:diguanylate cyclase (GGDEF)-like protein
MDSATLIVALFLASVFFLAVLVLIQVNRRKIAQLESLIRVDPLTGIGNRRSFDEDLRRSLATAERYGEDFALVLADVDHFKKVNDRYGHVAGDSVLRDLAYRLRANVRVGDGVYRFGGEEFALILPHTDIERARIAAEHIRRSIAQSGETMSFGVACRVRDGRSADSLINAADEALYKAKSSGRDRVVCAL